MQMHQQAQRQSRRHHEGWAETGSTTRLTGAPWAAISAVKEKEAALRMAVAVEPAPVVMAEFAIVGEKRPETGEG